MMNRERLRAEDGELLHLSAGRCKSRVDLAYIGLVDDTALLEGTEPVEETEMLIETELFVVVAAEVSNLDELIPLPNSSDGVALSPAVLLGEVDSVVVLRDAVVLLPMAGEKTDANMEDEWQMAVLDQSIIALVGLALIEYSADAVAARMPRKSFPNTSIFIMHTIRTRLRTSWRAICGRTHERNCKVGKGATLL